MTEPTYPAARAVARRIQPHFSEHLAEAREHGQQQLAFEPAAIDIEEIIDAAFWASLRREEDRAPTISLALLPPDQVNAPLRFETPISLDPAALTRLAAAVERPGIHLGVWREEEGMRVWGTTRVIPALCFVLEVIAPGLLVVKHSRAADSGKFVNVAVVEGDQIKVLSQEAVSLPDCPELVNALLGFESPASAAESINILTQLAVSMRAHKRGGSLLMVPVGSETWLESIVQPIRYAVSPAFSELADLNRADAKAKGERQWREALRRSIDAIAGLTAVDGATVITDRYELLGFGAKIARRHSWPQIERVILTEPVEGSVATVVNPAELGGTRHLSAAQFTQDQRDSVALVASQDGRFTIFAWSACEEMVHAHRVEALLL